MKNYQNGKIISHLDRIRILKTKISQAQKKKIYLRIYFMENTARINKKIKSLNTK